MGKRGVSRQVAARGMQREDECVRFLSLCISFAAAHLRKCSAPETISDAVRGAMVNERCGLIAKNGGLVSILSTFPTMWWQEGRRRVACHDACLSQSTHSRDNSPFLVRLLDCCRGEGGEEFLSCIPLAAARVRKCSELRQALLSNYVVGWLQDWVGKGGGGGV